MLTFIFSLGSPKNALQAFAFMGGLESQRGSEDGFLVGCPHCVENDNVTITSLQQKVGLAVHCPKCLEIPGLKPFCRETSLEGGLQRASSKRPNLQNPFSSECGPNLQLRFCSRLPRAASAPVPDRYRIICCEMHFHKECSSA